MIVPHSCWANVPIADLLIFAISDSYEQSWKRQGEVADNFTCGNRLILSAEGQGSFSIHYAAETQRTRTVCAGTHQQQFPVFIQFGRVWEIPV